MKIGDKIKRIRDIKGLKQEDIAALLKITPQAYSKVERNETKLDTERLEEIAKIFKMSVDDIQQFDERNLFMNNLQECKDSLTINNINNFYTNDQAMFETMIAQQREVIDMLKEELQFLRSQLNHLMKDSKSNT
jgi:transcriptional regulator with XRE-family HTH domain